MDVLQQGHDSLLVQAKNVDRCIELLDAAFASVKFELWGRECQIPWEFTVGENWRDQHDWKN